MSMTDPIADMLTRIRNGLNAKHLEVSIPTSKFKLACLKLLVERGFLTDLRVNEDENTIVVGLKYVDGQSVIRSIDRVSRPGRRHYVGSGDIRPVLNGVGLAVISTSKGVLTDKQARDEKVGGEVVFEVH